MTPARYQFTDLGSITRLTQWLMVFSTVFILVSLPLFLFDLDWLADVLHLPLWARSATAFLESQTGEMTFGVTWVLIFGACAFAALRWIYLANANAHALGAEGMQFTPGWAVGWYFVPIASLWKPYQAMKEIWQASAAGTDWRGVRVPRLLPWWWACWLISTLTSYGPFDPDDEAQRIAALVFLGILYSLLLALMGTFTTIIGRIWAMQRRRRAAST